MSKVMRRVLGPNGMTVKEFKISKREEPKKKVETKEPVEPKEPVESKEPVAVTADLVNSMELNEMRVLAKENDIKLGNRGKVKAREFLIKELNLEEVEL